MHNLERLDEETLLELSRRSDELGVLSVYVHDEPGRDHDATAIDLKNRYRELRRNVEADGGQERARDVARALERLAPRVEALTDTRNPGRGRIAFAALTGDWFVQLDSHLPVPNRLVMDSGPFIHPLLELLDEGRPAGVVLVSGDSARVMEWRLGRLKTLTELEQEYVQAPHERAGQIGGGPSGVHQTPMREQRQARERERADRFLDQIADIITRIAQERGWERLLVSGGDRWTEPFTSRLPDALAATVVQDTRVLAGLDSEALLDVVTDQLAANHAAREQRLAQQVRDAGLAGTGALGLSEVAAALNQGRVSHLVYDPEVRYRGSLSGDGVLYAHDEAGLGTQPPTPEPRLTERLVEQALATGARVSPVEGAASGVLHESEGIGALLRW